MASPTPQQLAAAEKALRFVFPNLQFVRSQITPEAAAFAFETVRRVDIGSRVAGGLFKLYDLSKPVHEWKDIVDTIVAAVEEALKDPQESVKSEIGLAYIRYFYSHGIQANLTYGEDVYPCPEFRFPLGF